MPEFSGLTRHILASEENKPDSSGAMNSRYIGQLLAGCAISGSIALMLSVIAISVSYHAPMGEEQPKVTDWFQEWGGIGSAIFTAGAFAATMLAIMTERQRRQEDIRRLDEQRTEDFARIEADQTDRDMVQARLVMTTCDYDERTMTIVSMTVANHSQQAILDVQLGLGPRSEALFPKKERWQGEAYAHF